MQEFARYTGRTSGVECNYILQWELVSQDVSSNTSRVKLQALLQVVGTGAVISWSRGSASLHTDSFGLANTYREGNHVVHDMTITVPHNSDGSGGIYIGGSIDTTFLMNGSCGGTITLPKIPRYFTKTPSLSVSSATTTSTTFKWSTSEKCNRVRYSLDGAGFKEVFTGNATSGSFTISGLNPNTSHRIYIECRRGDSNLCTNSNTISFSTLSNVVNVGVSGKWLKAVPYIGVSGSWRKANVYIGVNGSWRRVI